MSAVDREPVDPTEAKAPAAPQEPIPPTSAADLFLQRLDERFSAIEAKLRASEERYNTLGTALIKMDERLANNQPAAPAPQAASGTGNGLVDMILSQLKGTTTSDNNGPWQSFYAKYHEAADKKLLESMGKVLGVDIRNHVSVDQ